jgi:single-strand DNA-binding protein
MAGINKVILIGHLGRAPEVRTLESGTKVARFSLATTETFKDRNGERKDQTEWHNVICWRNLADVAEKYLTKGRQIYVEGKIRNRSWEDNGIKKYTTEIQADTFTMLGTKGDDAVASPIPMPTQEPPTSKSDNDLPPFLTEEDDLPF